MRLSLTNIGQISMNAHDLDRAVTFYKETLGMPHLFTVPPKMAFFDCSGVRLMLSLPETPEYDHAGSILYYRVEDIQAAHRELASRGVRFEGPPTLIAKMPSYDLWMAFFRDSEGNLLALMSEAARG